VPEPKPRARNARYGEGDLAMRERLLELGGDFAVCAVGGAELLDN
jgi:hypothetical protein